MMARKPKPHMTYTVVNGSHGKRMLFDTLEEAEAARDMERGESAWIVPPLGARL
jgi:hypothetical protein